MKQVHLFKRISSGILGLAFLVVLITGNVSAQAPTQSLYDIISGSSVHTTLKAAIDAAGLQTELSTTPAKTIFAPTDAAFNALPTGTVPQLLLNPTGLLKEILLYHVVSGSVASSSLTNGQLVNALNTSNTIKVTKTSEGGLVYVNQAKVTTADVQATNGVLHITDNVILPNKTVVDIAIGSSVHSTLVTAVIAAELLPALTNPFSKFTVFAPTNAAFEALPAGTLTTLLANPTGDLKNILLYHVIGDSLASNKLTDGQLLQPLNQSNTIKVTKYEDGDIYVNQANVITANLKEGNGIVHVIDKVILPNTSIVDIALNSNVHGTLVSAVIAAKLLPALTDPFSKITLFAPTDDAFNALSAGTLTTLLAKPEGDLTKVLLYHVVPLEVLSTSLENNQVAATLLEGQSVTVTINNGVFINGDAQVTTPNITAGNGVVHVINKVLMPRLTNANDNTFSSKNVYYDSQSNKIVLEGFVNENFAIYSSNGNQLYKSSADKVSVIEANNFNQGLLIMKVEGGSSYKIIK